MSFNKSHEDITETLRRKGKRIEKVTCVMRCFPKDGSFMQLIPVNDKIEVGAILEPNLDTPINSWLLIQIIHRIGVSSSNPADYATIKEYLEEIIISCKSCFEAYKKTRKTHETFFVSCGTEDYWIGENFMNIFDSLQGYWDVECTGIVTNSDNCPISIIRKA